MRWLWGRLSYCGYCNAHSSSLQIAEGWLLYYQLCDSVSIRPWLLARHFKKLNTNLSAALKWLWGTLVTLLCGWDMVYCNYNYIKNQPVCKFICEPVVHIYIEVVFVTLPRLYLEGVFYLLLGLQPTLTVTVEHYWQLHYFNMMSIVVCVCVCFQ